MKDPSMSLVPVLVTGGAGFIGTHLVRALVAKGSKTVVIDRVGRPQTLPLSRRLGYHRIEAYKIGLLNPKPLKSAKIVHLAAETSVEQSVLDPVSTVTSNIGVTCAALDFARKIDSPRFVHASTAAVYGNRDGQCKETDPPAPASPYAVSKLASEYYCKVFCSLYGIPTVILRYFNVYGPGQSTNYAGVITRFVTRALDEEPPIIFGDGNQTRDFIFVGDVVRATMAALEKPVPGGTIMNIGTGQPTSVRSIADRILRILKLEHLHPVHTIARRGDVRHSRADTSIARAKLGFRSAHGLDDGLLATIDWLRTSNRP
jgi:nucleoside-diphosphate-sugar epimerase